MIVVIAIISLAVAVIVFRCYGELANLRKQTDAAWTLIDAQMARRSELLASIQTAMQERTRSSGSSTPSLVGTEIHALLGELKGTEEKIEFARKYYNEIAATYDERLVVFPHSAVAAGLRLKPKEPLELSLTGSESLTANF